MKAIQKDLGKRLRVSTSTHKMLMKLAEEKDFSVDDFIQWMLYKLHLN